MSFEVDALPFLDLGGSSIVMLLRNLRGPHAVSKEYRADKHLQELKSVENEKLERSWGVAVILRHRKSLKEAKSIP